MKDFYSTTLCNGRRTKDSFNNKLNNLLLALYDNIYSSYKEIDINFYRRNSAKILIDPRQ